MIFGVAGVVLVRHAGGAGESRGIRAALSGVFEHGLSGRERVVFFLSRYQWISCTYLPIGRYGEEESSDKLELTW